MEQKQISTKKQKALEKVKRANAELAKVNLLLYFTKDYGTIVTA